MNEGCYGIILIVVIVVAIIVAIGCYSGGLTVGHAEATCWAQETAYVDRVETGVVCGDGRVVPWLSSPGAP